MPTDPLVEVITELRAQTELLRNIVGLLVAEKTPATGTALVNESLLSGPYGDPVVKAKSPRDWSGPDMKGRHFSECPPEYLDMLAERCDYFASKETDQVKASYAVKDAQRARGWAARLRSGWKRVDETPSEPSW